MKGSIGSYRAGKPAGLDHDLCAPSQGSSWVLGKAALAGGRAFPGKGSNGKLSVLGVVSAEIGVLGSSGIRRRIEETEAQRRL